MNPVEIKDLPGLVGQEVGVSDWVEVTQERVNQFAEATGDHQWIHVDVERATREIGGPIAHGYLTLSLIPFLGAGMLPVKGVTRGINYGSDKVRFTNMVRVGKRVRMRQKLIGAEAKAGGMQIKNECTIEIEGEERPACIAERSQFCTAADRPTGGRSAWDARASGARPWRRGRHGIARRLPRLSARFRGSEDSASQTGAGKPGKTTPAPERPRRGRLRPAALRPRSQARAAGAPEAGRSSRGCSGRG